jgi:hypothetical protein
MLAKAVRLDNVFLRLYVEAAIVLAGVREELERGEGASDMIKRIAFAVAAVILIAAIIIPALTNAANSAATQIESGGAW